MYASGEQVRRMVDIGGLQAPRRDRRREWRGAEVSGRLSREGVWDKHSLHGYSQPHDMQKQSAHRMRGA
jgi:hypothetical protein